MHRDLPSKGVKLVDLAVQLEADQNADLAEAVG